MMTHLGAVAAPTTRDTIGSPETEILYLDPDTAVLFAEVDAILCAALARVRRPLAPPATGCALVEPWPAGRSWGALVGPRRGPVHPVRAVQRGPPSREQLATKVNNPT
jgi:hypothetical protein